MLIFLAEKAGCFLPPQGGCEGTERTYAGLGAIRRWKDRSSAHYTYTAELFSIADEDGRLVVAGGMLCRLE